MMFVDDIVIFSENREQGEEQLERWMFALERRVIDLAKTVYLFEKDSSIMVRLQGVEVEKMGDFGMGGGRCQV